MATTRSVALVTGASSGIGQATAAALVEAGFEVIGTGRNTASIPAGDGVTFLDLDVTSDESVADVVQQVIERFGRLDVLVNNAGIGSAGGAPGKTGGPGRGGGVVDSFCPHPLNRAPPAPTRAPGHGGAHYN